MKKILFILIFVVSSFEAIASVKLNIINKLKDVKNISFDFEQNINGKLENGSCIIKYPKKINCKYDQSNKKVLVSNGNSLVIKTSNSYYIYPLKKTPLDLILDKNFLLKKIKDLKERKIQNKFVNFSFNEKENNINLFFDINTYNLVGWQTVDIYQNVSITYLSAIRRNQKLNESLFLLPSEN
tara:strand:+ start:241 stop:789 length:549 start_codon:yes stop_codon:yes gene_type:complete